MKYIEIMTWMNNGTQVSFWAHGASCLNMRDDDIDKRKTDGARSVCSKSTPAIALV